MWNTLSLRRVVFNYYERLKIKIDIKKIYITASGGPFNKLPLKKFSSINNTQALKHPNWSMGKKITVDSATMMNKAIEIIEIHRAVENFPAKIFPVKSFPVKTLASRALNGKVITGKLSADKVGLC